MISFFRAAVIAASLNAACLRMYAHELDASRPDSHAPIGVMGDHIHKQGEWMVDYRYMIMEMSALRQGGSRISNQEAFAQGFDLLPKDMTMQMHMFMVMYAPSDRVTFMAMTMYNESEMDMISKPQHGGMSHNTGGHMMPHGDMTSHSHSGHSSHGGHSHDTSGWGDTVLSALVELWAHEDRMLIGEIGFGLPTAEVEEKMNGMFQPYGMQLGNGVWDFRPALTYVAQTESLSYGAQLKARINLENENDAGFLFGNEYEGSLWIARPLSTIWSLSGRLTYSTQDSIDGHYNGPHAHSAPNHFQQNDGGDRSEVGLGMNFRVPEGKLTGHRLAAEVLVPIHEDVNGVQLSRDYSFSLGWQFAW